MTSQTQPLPIDSLIPEIVRALDKHNCAVVVAEPGAGKTTRVPPSLLSSGFIQDREIWVLQPRRLAAKMAYLRVAEELGEEPGQRVGYQFRFENKTGPKTRLRFMTDGMLLPLAQGDPRLSKVAAVILDEFHERSLALEMSLAWIRQLQLGPRPDLRLLVMSATLDSGALSSYLSDCPVLKSSGRVFPVEISYHPFPQDPDLSLKVKHAVRQTTAPGKPGTTLVFLPGLGEIKKCQSALRSESFEVQALYGDLTVQEQQAALKPSPGIKVILSTNVAETSLTVPGVTTVIDSGLTRQSRVSAWSGLQSLVTVPASQASAAQRAGRAGRLQAGTCVRLYTKFDFEHRAAFDIPEILRTDLSKTLLDLKQLGVEDLEAFPWFLKPNAAALGSALLLLRRLGALKDGSALTETGRRMARFPLAPRLAKFLLEAESLGQGSSEVSAQARRLAVLIGEERSESEDLLEELKKYRPGFESQRLEEQVERLLKENSKPSNTPHPVPLPQGARGKSKDEVLAKALLSAFPDRVAQVRKDDKKELVLCEGGSAQTRDSALIRAHDYFVVVEAQELGNPTKGKGPQHSRAEAKVRSLCPIEMDWLLDFFADDLIEEKTLEWNQSKKRIEGFKRLKYGQLVLDESPLLPQEFGEEGEKLLMKEALAAGPSSYCDPEELNDLLCRAKFVGERRSDFPRLTSEQVEETLRTLCQGCRSLEDLKASGLAPALRGRLSHSDQALLEKWAPASSLLPSGRRITIHYEEGKPPWAESRIQDFFGMRQGPTVGGGDVPVVLHLLSPAKRPVQVTSDLAGFWKNHYPQTRKELSRRYPRHKWPENPA